MPGCAAIGQSIAYSIQLAAGRLPLARRARLIPRRAAAYYATDRGFDRYHDLERWVTYHLIEPLRDEMLQEHPAPDRPRRHARRRAPALPAATETAIPAE